MSSRRGRARGVVKELGARIRALLAEPPASSANASASASSSPASSTSRGGRLILADARLARRRSRRAAQRRRPSCRCCRELREGLHPRAGLGRHRRRARRRARRVRERLGRRRGRHRDRRQAAARRPQHRGRVRPRPAEHGRPAVLVRAEGLLGGLRGEARDHRALLGTDPWSGPGRAQGPPWRRSSRARARARAALETLRETGYYLGRGFATIVKAIEPRRIYVGGEITEALGSVCLAVRQALRDRRWSARRARPRSCRPARRAAAAARRGGARERPAFAAPVVA